MPTRPHRPADDVAVAVNLAQVADRLSLVHREFTVMTTRSLELAVAAGAPGTLQRWHAAALRRHTEAGVHSVETLVEGITRSAVAAWTFPAASKEHARDVGHSVRPGYGSRLLYPSLLGARLTPENEVFTLLGAEVWRQLDQRSPGVRVAFDEARASASKTPSSGSTPALDSAWPAGVPTAQLHAVDQDVASLRSVARFLRERHPAGSLGRPTTPAPAMPMTSLLTQPEVSSRQRRLLSRGGR